MNFWDTTLVRPTVVEDHAGEADEGVVRVHFGGGIVEEFTGSTSLEDLEQDVEGWKTADAATVALADKLRGEGLGVNGGDGFQEPLIGKGGFADGSGMGLEGIPVAGADVGEIDARQDAHGPSAGLHGLPEGVHHIRDGFDSLFHLFHAEGAKKRDDADLGQEEPEEERLELNRVFPAVSELIGKEIKGGTAAKLANEVAIHRHRPERCFEIFSRESEATGERLVPGSENDTGTDGSCLHQGLVGIGKRGSARAEIDVGRHQAEESPPESARFRLPWTAMFPGEKPQELVPKLLRIGLVPRAGEKCGTARLAAELGDNLLSVGSAPVVFQEEVGVQLPDELFQVLPEEHLTELAHAGSLNIHQAVGTIHQGDQEVCLLAEDKGVSAQSFLILKDDVYGSSLTDRNGHQAVSQPG
jgi:hypothetical protein